MTLKQMAARLRAAALAYPGAYEDHPWGEPVAKVGRKVFAFYGVDSDGLGLTVKLPSSGAMALGLPFAEPTGYNLGRSGWVSASFERARDVPLDVLLEWLDESYRAVAPKKLIAKLDAATAAAAPARAPRSRAEASRRRAARGRASRR